MIIMNRKKILTALLLATITTSLLTTTIHAQEKTDFLIDTNTSITYKTGEDIATVKNEYIRTVKNANYYLAKDGEKVFHIPDTNSKAEEVKKEREFKLESLTVTDSKGIGMQYEVEESEIGGGILIHIPYNRATTAQMPYTIIMTYKTHDNIIRNGGLTTIMASALPKDTVFQKSDEKNETTTQFNYNLSIVVDKDIQPLARAFPTFTTEERGDNTLYKFAQESRRGNPPTLEFGTNVKYKFELEYKTPKTDHAIPEQYSNLFKAISTNIYQISLPRESEETKQRVLIQNIYPLPTNIHRDNQGNVIATFELGANREDTIRISGYVSSSRGEYSSEINNSLNIPFADYIKKIDEDRGNLEYLKATKFWEVKNPYIQTTAKDLLAGKNTLLEVIDADYQFVNDVLEYDESKANSNNERIGAVNALTGGASVCMEYADSMIALLRAQGIPARAALGYTNITEEQTELVRHEWVQVWVPEYGWIGIDPTYESTNRKIGQLIDRVLWETFNEDSLSNISIFSADSLDHFNESDYKINIYSVNEIPAHNLMTYEEILPEQNIDEQPQYSAGNWLNTLFKTTVLGRAILVTLPVVILIIVVTITIAIIKTLIKRSRTRKQRLSKSV